MADEIKVRKRKLSEYQHDPNNPNKGSTRGKLILTKSLKERGAARSVVAASDDVFLAGNQTVDAAREVGITDVIEIETDGSALVVVKRRDLRSGDDEARLLAYEDNRARDPASWDAEQVLIDLEAGLQLDHLFRLDELDELQQDLQIETQIDQLASDGGTEGEGGDRRIKHMVAEKQIKPVLYAKQIDVFERALRQTHIVNRGDALIAVCQFYLEHHGQDAQAR